MPAHRCAGALGHTTSRASHFLPGFALARGLGRQANSARAASRARDQVWRERARSRHPPARENSGTPAPPWRWPPELDCLMGD
eukprot:3792172-Alexandrium_andersonii.AAC.1